MSEHDSQTAGTNADELDTNTQVNAPSDADTTDDGASKKKSWVPKILAEKNAAIKEAEDLRAELESLKANSISKDNLDATLELLNEEKNVLSNLDEDGLEKYNAMKEDAKYKSLRPNEIAQLMWVTRDSSQPNKLSIQWNTPASFKKKATIADASDEDLRAGAEEELRAMLG